MILLVEDSEDDVALALHAFRKHAPAQRIHVAEDGDAALEFLHGKDGHPSVHPLPSVVLLDLKLRGLSGHEVLARVRQAPRTRLLPVVVLTSSLESADVERAYALGANSYLQKPVSLSAFVAVARRIHDYWLGLNQTPPS